MSELEEVAAEPVRRWYRSWGGILGGGTAVLALFCFVEALRACGASP